MKRPPAFPVLRSRKASCASARTGCSPKSTPSGKSKQARGPRACEGRIRTAQHQMGTNCAGIARRREVRRNVIARAGAHRDGDEELLALGEADELAVVVLCVLRRKVHLERALHPRRHLAAAGAQQRLRRLDGEGGRVGREDLDPPVDVVVVAEAEQRGVLAQRLERVEDHLGRRRLEERLLERHDRRHVVRVLAHVEEPDDPRPPQRRRQPRLALELRRQQARRPLLLRRQLGRQRRVRQVLRQRAREAGVGAVARLVHHGAAGARASAPAGERRGREGEARKNCARSVAAARGGAGRRARRRRRCPAGLGGRQWSVGGLGGRGGRRAGREGCPTHARLTVERLLL